MQNVIEDSKAANPLASATPHKETKKWLAKYAKSQPKSFVKTAHARNTL